jgi:hypothetical protein
MRFPWLPDVDVIYYSLCLYIRDPYHLHIWQKITEEISTYQQGLQFILDSVGLVAGSCEHGDEPSGSGTKELVNSIYLEFKPA